MDITGNISNVGYPASTAAAYRTERTSLPESSPDSSDEADALASIASTTVPRRSESIAQVESELSRQLAVSQTTGAEADGAVPDTTTATGSKRPASTSEPEETTADQRPSSQSVPTETTPNSQLTASTQLAVAQYQAHQSLLETSSDLAGRRLFVTA